MVRIAYDQESGTEITDEGPFEVLNMHGLPANLIPSINRYNRDHQEMDDNPINITRTCIDALKNALKDRGIIIEKIGSRAGEITSEKECAEEMEDFLEDIDGNELEVGDKVGFTISGPDAYNHYIGMVCQADDVYCVDCGRRLGLFRIDNDLINLRKLNDMPDDEPRSRGVEYEYVVVDEGVKTPECSVCDEGE